MNLAEAKQRLTIYDLWRPFECDGEPSKSCRCPFHEDGSNSFSVNADGTLFNCFAGCGGGDTVDFFALATGLPHGEACRGFIALASGSPVSCVPRPPRLTPAAEAAMKVDARSSWPLFESPTSKGDTLDGALGVVANLRHVSIDGARIMAARGLLWFTVWKELPAWVVTDSARLNAQARRMDGKLWEDIEKKAQTLPGSEARRPVGASEARLYPTVLLCEGGPDLLAAFHFIEAHGREGDTTAVAMLGAGMNIHPDALPLLANKQIRIMAHTDHAGRDAAVRWGEQLAAVNATVDVADFSGLLMTDGSPVEDLNDTTRIDPKQESELLNLIPE